ncbi:response regulator receiver protein (plasmid) [Burkholderia sp. KK1]|uniref:response regulator transcription factor n=1 Tax=Caballeronia sp. CLC5 TaxID=2906764 RepID=UPI0002387F64|nr:response regulator [Caballeronia sp. CLC5]AET94824.1 response regulator receiver protein [Burkholderia sp. YI23]AQH03782.1 response regulator receiver protein [Burkholderia sp. KK1]MCE4571950.1 response regulator [Caballeronia sp. CLC5]BAO91338.1 response regulator receiver protein [Burkholderia sp. RPE67]
MQPPSRVSVIDDDESVRVASSSLLRSLGWEVSLYPSAESFFDADPLDGLACVITDLNMPGMSGLQLQQRLRALKPRVPVMFITAFASDAARRQAIDGGAVCFLSKPVDGAAVADCLERIKEGFLKG